MKMYNIEYSLPRVTLLQESGLGVAEVAGRTCYDSFDKSENQSIRDKDYKNINKIESSELLDSLAWVHHHHSIIEHSTLSYLIEGSSRGVLQEHARHRIQAISVRSTRYTMSSVINAFVASINNFDLFFKKLLELDLFVVIDREYLKIEIQAIYNKLIFQYKKDDSFISNAIAKSSIVFLEKYKNNSEELYQALQNGKKKRNVGDAFKHIVSDNWKVDMVVSFNLRSLKNYFDLRDSGSAYFQIRWLAKAMKKATPKKYLKLIDREYRSSLTLK